MSYFWKENKYLEDCFNNFIKYIEDKNQTEFNGNVSMFLLGSLSRGEGSWKMIDGKPTIVSDIEFITLVPVDFDKTQRLSDVIDEARSLCFKDQNSSLFHIDIGISAGGFNLSKLERKLITFDAQEYGKFVVGKDYKNTLPHITIENINMHDIWEILVHRMFSVLYWGRPLKENGRMEEYRYNLAKNTLDLMTVVLINHGMLVSGFANRFNAINSLDIDTDTKKFFEYCLSIKLSTDCPYSFSIEEMEHKFLCILVDAEKSFSSHIHNNVVNARYIVRRHLGQLKRAIHYKKIPCTQRSHLYRMISIFKSSKTIPKRCIFDNLILNGYPTL